MDKSIEVKIKNLLKEIKENNHKHVYVYSLDGCPACEEYKTKVKKLGLTYENIEMAGNEKMWKKLSEMGGSDFVPQVEVNGYLIKEDEYNDVNQLISKTLTNLLQRKIVIK